MDDLLKKAFDIANRMEVLSNQKLILKEEFSQNLMHYYQGGTFTVSKELIIFIKFLLDSGNTTDIVIIDDNDTPILVNDLKDFFEKIVHCYFSSVNEYYTKFSNLVKQRSVESLLG